MLRMLRVDGNWWMGHGHAPPIHHKRGISIAVPLLIVYTVPMLETQDAMTIEELADRVGVPIRTIRFYITEGLLPGPGGRGKAATYGEEHLVRLRLIRRLAERHVPLAEMRERLGRLSLAEARALLADEEAHTAELERAAQAESPRDYIAGLLEGMRPPPSPPSAAARLREAPGPYQTPPPAAPHGESWRRWELAPGVELFAREDILAARQELIERLLDVAHPDSETRKR